jgi:uncharacterized OB-fold protein
MNTDDLARTYRITDSGDVHLLAGRLQGGHRMVFPRPGGLDAALYDVVELPDRGILWSFTIQRFCPKAPYVGNEADFAPYPVGYIEFDGLLTVEARLDASNFESLRIGMEMAAGLMPIVKSDGTEMMIPCFRPTADVP